MIAPTEPLEDILIEPAAGCRLLHIGTDVLQCEVDARIIARVILAHVLSLGAAEQLTPAFVQQFNLTEGQVRLTRQEIRKWAELAA